MGNFLSLHKKFVQLGRQKFKLTNELLAILPEIYKSGVYKKYTSSIFEYSAKFGGLSHSAVEKRLRLEKHLQDKPKLKEAIKEVGLNKVSMIATLATPETEEAFVDKIKNMSKMAVQTLSKELRQKENISEETVCEAKPQTIKLELDEEMTFLFLKLKKKWGKAMSNKEVMARILAEISESEFPRHVAKRSAVTSDDLPKERKNNKIVEPKLQTRYVPAHKRRKAFKDGKCSYPGCNKPSKDIHHQHRFSQSKSHNSIIALCHEHHEFMHNGLVQNEKADAGDWRLDMRGQAKNRADILYRKFRQKTLL